MCISFLWDVIEGVDFLVIRLNLDMKMRLCDKF